MLLYMNWGNGCFCTCELTHSISFLTHSISLLSNWLKLNRHDWSSIVWDALNFKRLNFNQFWDNCFKAKWIMSISKCLNFNQFWDNYFKAKWVMSISKRFRSLLTTTQLNWGNECFCTCEVTHSISYRTDWNSKVVWTSKWLF
jgi:hypothetical protein